MEESAFEDLDYPEPDGNQGNASRPGNRNIEERMVLNPRTGLLHVVRKAIHDDDGTHIIRYPLGDGHFDREGGVCVFCSTLNSIDRATDCTRCDRPLGACCWTRVQREEGEVDFLCPLCAQELEAEQLQQQRRQRWGTIGIVAFEIIFWPFRTWRRPQ